MKNLLTVCPWLSIRKTGTNIHEGRFCSSCSSWTKYISSEVFRFDKKIDLPSNKPSSSLKSKLNQKEHMLFLFYSSIIHCKEFNISTPLFVSLIIPIIFYTIILLLENLFWHIVLNLIMQWYSTFSVLHSWIV